MSIGDVSVNCPYCAERIKPQAILCRFCGKDLTPGTASATSDSQIEETPTLGIQDNHSPLRLGRSSSLTQNQKIAAIVLVAVFLLTGGSLAFSKFSQIQEENRIAAAAQARADAAEAAAQAELKAYQAAVNDNSWLPDGFTKFADNPYVAYKQIRGASCSYGTCFTFNAVTNKYCSSLYVEANSVTTSGVVDDYGNDIARGISAGQLVRMKIQFTSESDGTVRFTKVNCN
jgi:hypothetical protein